MSSSRNPQLYVGGLDREVRTEELHDKFKQYGKVREISHKNRYAFVVSSL
jgi:RNA recognition motif-containing protein